VVKFSRNADYRGDGTSTRGAEFNDCPDDTNNSLLKQLGGCDRYQSQQRPIYRPGEAFIDMASNLHEASLALHHIDNYLFVGSSACEVLRRQSLACFHYVDDPSAGHASAYGNADFIHKMNIRTDMILEALAANFTVVHRDLEVAFHHNPFDEIRVNYFVVPCIICYSV